VSFGFFNHIWKFYFVLEIFSYIIITQYFVCSYIHKLCLSNIKFGTIGGTQQVKIVFFMQKIAIILLTSLLGLSDYKSEKPLF
jgi:hypothetical protein